jgi:hypothetical protein
VNFPRRSTGLAGDFLTGKSLHQRSRCSPLISFARSAVLGALLCGSAAFGASNVIEIGYDNAGNIVQLKRQVPGGFAITGFTPASGPVGAAVTVYGAGFSATPANNLVKFNGVTATVSASDSGSISTTLPSGATTGRITVTVASSTATSAQDFVVTIPGAPTITSFTPVSGTSGTSVAVTGTGFEVAAGATTVKLNGVTAAANISTATDLSLTVPSAASSGRITATTSIATGMSAQDFIVPPTGVTAADIITTVRIAPGGPSGTLNITTPSKHGLVLFDGTANTFFTVQFGQLAASPTSPAIPYKVIAPDNTVLVTGTVGGPGPPTIHLPKLPANGTYSILVSPGLTTLNSNVKVAADPIMVIDGAAAALALDSVSQTARLVFDATANQRIGLGIMGLALLPASSTASTFTVFKPDGTALANGTLCTSATTANPEANCDVEILAPVAGTYTLVAQIVPGSAGSFSAQISSEVTGALAIDAGADITLARVGQDGRYTFSVSAGDSLAVDLSGLATLPRPQNIKADIFPPTGLAIGYPSAMQPAGGYFELGTGAAAGTYTVQVDPSYGAYGALRLTLKQGPVITTADSPLAFATSAIAERARFRFAGTAGQNLSVALSTLSYVGSSSSAGYVNVYRPDGVAIGTGGNCSPTSTQGSCRTLVPNLPVSGTYSIAVQGPAGVKLSGAVLVSADVTGTLVSGTPLAVTAARPGQAARVTFSATAGDSTSLKLYGVTTTPAGPSLGATVYKPDGSYFTSITASSGSPPTIQNLASMPVSGTYTIVVDPGSGVTWQATLALDPGTALTVDGPAATLASTNPGEPIRYRFNATAGQRLDVGIAGIAYSPANSGYTSTSIYRPDGTTLLTLNCFPWAPASCEASSASLPSTGVYAAIVSPPTTTTMAGGTFALSTPLAGSFVVGDPAQTVAVTRPGQTARYTFSGTAAQLLRLNWTSTTVSGGQTVAVSILKPDGLTLISTTFSNAATGFLNTPQLPTTGVYTVVLDPSSAATFSTSASLVTQ